MNILSLFDGASCGQIAANKADLVIDNYYASEIDESAIIVTQSQYPGTKQIGDVRTVSVSELPFIPDLIIGGSPCQDISSLKKNNKGLDGDKSSLFYEFLRIKEEAEAVNPEVFFLLENVDGNKAAINEITKLLKCRRRPIKFNSNLVSAQNRPRLYWTNIPVN